MRINVYIYYCYHYVVSSLFWFVLLHLTWYDTMIYDCHYGNLCSFLPSRFPHPPSFFRLRLRSPSSSFYLRLTYLPPRPTLCMHRSHQYAGPFFAVQAHLFQHVSASYLGLKVWENELEIVCRTRRLGRFREQAPFPIWGSSGRVAHVVALRLLCGANGSFDSSLTGTVRTSKLRTKQRPVSELEVIKIPMHRGCTTRSTPSLSTFPTYIQDETER